VKGPGWRNW